MRAKRVDRYLWNVDPPPTLGSLRLLKRELAVELHQLPFYGSQRWKEFRRIVLSQHPLCVECERLGRVVEATELDHIVPRRVRPDLAYALANVQGLCKSHHSAKTRRGL